VTAAPVLARTLKFKVTVSTGTATGKVFIFDKPIVKIGRGPENDLMLNNDPKISRDHVEIRAHLGQLVVRNISLRNFILVYGENVYLKRLKCI
jgi:pSer/pThr/pTyr-binding forkhead associated (FHA) protein